MIGVAVASADRVGDVIVVQTEYRDSELVRSIPGARYKSDENRWHVPLSWAGFLTLHGVLGHRLEIGPDLSAWYGRFATEFVQPALALRESITVTDETPSPYLSALREVMAYQRWDA